MEKFYPPYREPSRNQFHYSPPIGWMNDINGCWYLDGVYHITYQYSPDGLQCHNDSVSVGHAYSKDLVHWYPATVAVFSGKQSKDGIWSGTALVDRENRAGFGENAVIMANTAKYSGQHINVSTDGGWDFTAIKENPVVSVANFPDAPRWEQRDPKIFWLEQAKCFIMVLYWALYGKVEDLDTEPKGCFEFYASKDMKHWERFQCLRNCDIINDLERQGKDSSRVKNATISLYECPVMYPMMYEGVTYWVLAGGDSRYLLGRFDGLHYTVLDAPLEPLSYGPDFYAGQTFANTDRTLAVYWLGCWNKPNIETYPFRNSTTVVTELSMHKTPNGLRIFRNPVPELDSLHKDAIPFAGTAKAPYFDLQFTVDWAKTTAETFTLQIGEKNYTITKNRFSCSHKRHWLNLHLYQETHTETTFALDGKDLLQVRVLVDRDSVEIFMDGGLHNYTEEYGPQTEETELQLIPQDGKQLSVHGVYYTMDSIWA